MRVYNKRNWPKWVGGVKFSHSKISYSDRIVNNVTELLTFKVN